MTKIKICGLTEVSQAVGAAEAGADFLGLVFAQSTRQINPKMAATIVHAVKSTPEKPQVVGVFVNAPLNDVNFIAQSCHLDWVQLSGDESCQYCQQIKFPVIKVIHVFSHLTAAQILEDIRKAYTFLSPDHLKILLDSKVKGAYGGTGQRFDWKLAAETNSHYPVIVAGGLDADNVVQMLNDVKPWGVDVSSGVETHGKKDLDKIRLFIQRARSVR